MQCDDNTNDSNGNSHNTNSNKRNVPRNAPPIHSSGLNYMFFAVDVGLHIGFAR